ncbi:MAG TPA: hypothetical protein VHO50_12935 [Bacteroidales bacterium]|nr:hypothetical protein [Bacteroidales bacterium]
MKIRTIFTIAGAFVLLLFSFVSLQIDKKYTGKWTFEAPDAPEGSTKGSIEIRPGSVIMTFDEAVAFTSNWAKMKKDSLIYETTFDMATVLFSLRIIDDDNIKGKAVWKEGETSVYLKKAVVTVML